MISTAWSHRNRRTPASPSSSVRLPCCSSAATRGWRGRRSRWWRARRLEGGEDGGSAHTEGEGAEMRRKGKRMVRDSAGRRQPRKRKEIGANYTLTLQIFIYFLIKQYLIMPHLFTSTQIYNISLHQIPIYTNLIIFSKYNLLTLNFTLN